MAQHACINISLATIDLLWDISFTSAIISGVEYDDHGTFYWPTPQVDVQAQLRDLDKCLDSETQNYFNLFPNVEKGYFMPNKYF